MKRLDGKVALVTGAAPGICKACAELFAKEGAFVFVTDVNDVLGKSVAADIGAQAYFLHLDVQLEANWGRVIDYIVSDKKSLDILVNNAGITGFQEGFGPQDPEHTSLDDWRKVHAVNSDGTFLGCKVAIGAMKKGRGSIVNISSRSGLIGIPGAAAYASSKASVRNHSKTVALYCCQQGYDIRCNSIHPAAILTPMWEPMLGTGEDRDARMKQFSADIPMGRLGESIDVAMAALFLASDESKYITGTEMTIDGGLLAGSSASPKKV
jgi:3(or 17)beta-hydroxysteroid dehydrogenase